MCVICRKKKIFFNGIDIRKVKMRENFTESVHVSEAPETIAGTVLTEVQRAAYKRTFLDTEATMAANRRSSFPYSKEEILERAKLAHLRLFATGDYDVLSEDFQFAGPVVGPLNKSEFCATFPKARITGAFPNATSGVHGMYVDPFNPARVWYCTVFDGVHDGDDKLMGYIEKTNRRVRMPPQMVSLTFDDQGLVRKLTAGYVLDRHVGNSGGLGALFGILYAIGKPLPFPEGKPYQKSWQLRFFEWLSRLFPQFSSLGPQIQDASSSPSTSSSSLSRTNSVSSKTD